jgi:hypothetical protein
VPAGSRQDMHYKQLSSLGEVSLLGLGCGGLGSLTALARVVKACL